MQEGTALRSLLSFEMATFVFARRKEAFLARAVSACVRILYLQLQTGYYYAKDIVQQAVYVYYELLIFEK